MGECLGDAGLMGWVDVAGDEGGRVSRFVYGGRQATERAGLQSAGEEGGDLVRWRKW